MRCSSGKISLRGKSTTNILLEGAAWNFINIRRTAKQHNLPSEASFRFSRGVHPALAEIGVKRGLQFMAEWSGGKVAPGLVDEYPLKPKDAVVEVTPQDVKRLLGIDLTPKKLPLCSSALNSNARSRARPSQSSPRLIAWTLVKASSVSPMCSKKSRALRLRQHPRNAHGRRAPAADRQSRP